MGELAAAGEGSLALKGQAEAGGAMEAAEAPSAASAASAAPAASAASAALEKEVKLLDEMLEVWKKRAMNGATEAVEKVLEIQKQRLVLLQLWPEGQRSVKVSAGAASRADEREVRVVVEYVDDWRQAGRRSAD